jgi:cytochrome c biogenesis protein CcdA
MTSLSDVYEGAGGRVATRRQQLVGTGLFLAGAAGLVGAIALATTGIGAAVGLDDYAAREVAGIVAGVGLPAVVLGIFAVLPAGPRTRLIAVGGAAVAGVGVVAFQQIYPYNWMANAPLLALGASTIYFAGVLTTFWCLFAALATFKTRKDPGGTARMNVTEEGTIELVEESRSIPGLGGIGFFGQDPDGAVETQTNRRDQGRTATSDGGEAQRTTDNGDGSEVFGTTQSPTQPSGTERSRGSDHADRTATTTGPSEHELDPRLANAGPEASPSTDGGTTSATGQDPITETAVHRGEPDSYCGNCRHFQYVMDGDDIEPYCSLHGDVMDDMDACSAWVDNE